MHNSKELHTLGQRSWGMVMLEAPIEAFHLKSTLIHQSVLDQDPRVAMDLAISPLSTLLPVAQEKGAQEAVSDTDQTTDTTMQ